MLRTVLAVDAAWTVTQPSGVALCQRKEENWHCLAIAPSYDSFVALANGREVEWDAKRFTGDTPDVRRLMEAACAIAGSPVDLIAVDMPLATIPVCGRRVADSRISIAFGKRGCSTHTPSPVRPGPLGTALRNDLTEAGFRLASASTEPKSTRYWPAKPVQYRIAKLVENFTLIYGALELTFRDMSLPLPTRSVDTLAGLKRYEDALDALICAWVGTKYLAGEARAFGDETAAIWCPDPARRPPVGARNAMELRRC